MVEFGDEFVQAIVGVFCEAATAEAGGEANGGGDGACGNFAEHEGGGSDQAEKGRDGGGSEGEVEGVVSLADAFDYLVAARPSRCRKF